MTMTVPGMRITAITAGARRRQDMGDIDALAASVNSMGLLHPVVVLPGGRLVAGLRRLEACRRLGWQSVPVACPDSLAEAVALLKAERDASICRKPMLPSELASLGVALYEVEDVSARRHAGAPPPHGGGDRVRDAVGEALGIGGRTYTELRYVHRVATGTDVTDTARTLARRALAEMDAGRGITSAGQQLRHDLKTVPAAAPDGEWIPEPDDKHANAAVRRRELVARWTTAGMSSADVAERLRITEKAVYAIRVVQVEAGAITRPAGWVPAVDDRTGEAVGRRREILAEMASQGATSRQIAARLGIRAETVRRLARETGVTLSADKALGRNGNKKIDSNRIVRETVASLDGLDIALALVDYGELDPAETGGWAEQLGHAIGVLGQLRNRLVKEHHHAC